jgi:hypothetical protein
MKDPSRRRPDSHRHDQGWSHDGDVGVIRLRDRQGAKKERGDRSECVPKDVYEKGRDEKSCGTWFLHTGIVAVSVGLENVFAFRRSDPL